MKNEFGLLLLMLMYLTFEIIVMLGMARFLANGRIFFAIFTMCGVHYYASKTTEIFKKLIQDGE